MFSCCLEIQIVQAKKVAPLNQALYTAIEIGDEYRAHQIKDDIIVANSFARLVHKCNNE